MTGVEVGEDLLGVDSTTIFMVAKYDKDGEPTGKYDIYKGIKNVPDLNTNENCDGAIALSYIVVENEDGDEYAVVLVENAKKYTTSTSVEVTDPTSNYFVLLDSDPEITNEVYSEFEALVDGKKTTVKIDNVYHFDAEDEDGMFRIEEFEGNSGKKYISELTSAVPYETLTVAAAGCQNEVLYTDEAVGNIALGNDCKIVDLKGKTVKASALEAGDEVYVVGEAKNADLAAYIYVVETTKEVQAEAAAALKAAKKEAKNVIDAVVAAINADNTNFADVTAEDLKEVAKAQKDQVDEAATVEAVEAIGTLDANGDPDGTGVDAVREEAEALQAAADIKAAVESVTTVIATAGDAETVADAVEEAVNELITPATCTVFVYGPYTDLTLNTVNDVKVRITVDGTDFVQTVAVTVTLV